MSERNCLALVLAAGEGTRMRSTRPKVMHAVAGRPMLGHVIAAARAAGAGRVAVVIGPDMAEAADFVRAADGAAALFVQAERRGTAHAVLAARAALDEAADDVVVLYGDTPLISPQTIAALRARLAAGAGMVVLGFRPADPTGYGRLLVDTAGRLAAIREEADASAAERRVDLCNSGVTGFAGRHLPGLLARIGNDNAKGEYYLTDAVALARADGLAVEVIECAEEEVLGVNSRAELARAEALAQARLRRRALDAGVTMTDPQTVFLSHDTELGRDVLVEPDVVFGPGVTVGEGATIRAFSHLEGAHVAAGASIGPFARLRPGSDIGTGARIGNFVEVKSATVAAGAKINHLTYIGDASIGARANIGAGTITCNYDGVAKHRTEIGADAFIGSNSALVAPVSIGAGAYVGSGSVITRDVEPGALALARARQTERRGWAARFREKFVVKKTK